MSVENFMMVVGKFSHSISRLVYLKQHEVYFKNEIDPIQWNDAYQAACESWADLESMAHSISYCSVMEAVESSSWWYSPEEDFDFHCRLVRDIYDDVVEGAIALENAAEHIDDEEDEDEVYEFSASKDHLESCLSL